MTKETPQNPEVQQAVKRLSRFLTRGNASGYGFCVADDERHIPHINKSLLTQTANKNIKAEHIFLSPDSDLPLIEQFKKPAAKALIVGGLFDFLMRRPDKTGFTELNFIREAVVNLDIPIIFWVNRRTLSDIGNYAHDFFSQRAFATHFIETPAEIVKTTRSLQIENNSTQEEQEKTANRILLLSEQLEKMQQSKESTLRILQDALLPLANAYAEEKNIVKTLELLTEYQYTIDEGNADIFLETADIYHAIYQYETALAYYDLAAKEFQAKEDKEFLSYTYSKISDIYYIRGEYETTLTYLEKSLAIKKEIGDRKEEGIILNNISQIHKVKGDYTSALIYLEESLAIHKEIGNRQGEGGTLNNISQIHKVKGDYTSALIYLEKSLAIQKEIGDRQGLGTTFNNISQIYNAKNDYASALVYLEKSLAIHKEIGNRQGESNALNNIAITAYAKRDYVTALTYLEQSLAIKKKIGNRQGEGSILNNISQIYDAKGDYATALTYLKQSLVILKEIGDVNGTAVTLFNIAYNLIGMKKAEKAIKFAWQSLKIFQQINLLNEIKDGENLLNQLSNTIGKKKYNQILKKAKKETDLENLF